MMISISDNTAADMLIRLAGRSAVQAQDRQAPPPHQPPARRLPVSGQAGQASTADLEDAGTRSEVPRTEEGILIGRGDRTVRAGPSVDDLVTRARTGDKQAWDTLADRYASLIWSICRRHQLDDADAGEVGDVLLRSGTTRRTPILL